LAAVLFNSGDDSGDNVLSVPAFFDVGMPLISHIFFLLASFNNFKYLRPLQGLVAIGLISENFHLFCDFYSCGKGDNKIFHFWHCM
jgi:hypothetical protein